MIQLLYTCDWPDCKRKETEWFDNGMTRQNVQPKRLHRLPDDGIYCLHHMRLYKERQAKLIETMETRLERLKAVAR